VWQRLLNFSSRFVSNNYRRRETAATTRKHKRATGAILLKMPGEKEDLVRRANASMSASPEDIRTTAGEFWDADADYYPARKFPEAQPCHGLKEITDSLVRFREMWSRFEWTVHEVIEVGDERALSRMTLNAEGRESGAELEGDVYESYWFRHGRLLRVEDHLTLRGALHALGLEGETLEAAGLRAPSNLDLVRSIFAAWERGDYSSAEWADPEIEYIHADGPARGSWTGLAGMAEGWRSWLSAWDDLRQEVEEYRELDDERVLVLSHGYGRGKTSGLETGQIRTNAATLFHVRGGKVARLVIYFDRDRAFSDLGLTSETGSAPL
jgi:ketosteroid isomerase-like protein